MQKTPRGLRLQIGIFGRRNVGKSSLLNALTRQQVSIVSGQAGTTTDPVEKAMEMLPLGPVLFIDTAGIDDVGSLGEMRVERTRKIFERTDIAFLVARADEWGEFEENIIVEFRIRKTPLVIVFNKCDLASPDQALLNSLQEPMVETVATEGRGVAELREALIRVVSPDLLAPATIAGDLITPGELVMLVVPIDLEAPRGRLILPQVQTIRDILDSDSCCMIVKEREYRDALDRLKKPPALVVTDSQAFLKVAGDTPEGVPLTSFSILFARFKGDLATFVQGAMAIDDLRSGDRVLIAEACSHHPIGEDIGRVKIPRWLGQYVGGRLNFEFSQGHDFARDIARYSLIVHCGSCTFNRRQMLSRLEQCTRQGVPITNYGMTIAWSMGIFERALQPFPEAMEVYRNTLPA